MRGFITEFPTLYKNNDIFTIILTNDSEYINASIKSGYPRVFYYKECFSKKLHNYKEVLEIFKKRWKNKIKNGYEILQEI